MIIFLFGTWGSGKSYVGNLLEDRIGLPHIEADLHFDKKMLAAIHQRKFHQLDMSQYYDRVIADIYGFKRRAHNFIVSQAIYQDYFRQLIYNGFSPDILFVWVKTESEAVLKSRLRERAATGNPITPEVYDYMLTHWEKPTIPHDVFLNGDNIESQASDLLESFGFGRVWLDNEE